MLLESLAVSAFAVKGIIRTLGIPLHVYPRKDGPFTIVCLFTLNCVKECVCVCVRAVKVVPRCMCVPA